MPIAQLPGAALYYEVYGDGPWLAFAHGAGGNHLSWWQQVPAFARRFRCLVYDQRGWGRSTCDGPPDPGAFGSDLSALLDHAGADTAGLIGQSMGGWAVMGCALQAPRRITHLILTGTLAGLTDDQMLADLVTGHDPSGPFDGHLALAADFPEREPERTFLFDQIAAMNQPPTPEFLLALVQLRYGAGDRLRMPVRFIAGARDRLFRLDLVRRAYAKLPGADLVVVPDAGHSVYFERPLEFNRAVLQFLER